MRAWKQMRVWSGDKRLARWRPAAWLSALRERSTGRRRALLLQDIEELRGQLEEADIAQRQLREKYREATRLHREQRTQLLRLRVAEQLFEASVAVSGDDSEGTATLTRLLRLVMETVEAGGGILWLRAETEDALVPQVYEGRITSAARQDAILRIDTLSPSELRARCETALRIAPAAPQAAFTRLSAQSIPASLLTEDAVVSTQRLLARGGEETAGIRFRAAASGIASIDVQPPTEDASSGKETGRENAPPGVALLILRAEDAEAGAHGPVMCVVGVCDPRGHSRFTSGERERLQSLSRPLAAALRNTLQRVEVNRQLKAASQRHTASGKQRAPSPEAVYQNIVAQVSQIIPCENCTLFLLDAAGPHLEARATRGRVVNLLDHIRFERGFGVPGWLAAQGRPLHIADVKEETNLHNITMLPAQARSFLAVPLYANNAILGVLTVSHARAHAFSAHHVRLLSALAEEAAQTLPDPDKIILQAA